MTQRLEYTPLIAKGLEGFGQAYQYVAHSSLTKELVTLVYLRVSQINGCAYCIDLHLKEAKTLNMDPHKLSLLVAWEESGLFNQKEQTALRWAEIVTHVAQTAVPDAEYEKVKAEFSEQEIADLTFAIGLMNAYNRLAVSFRRTLGS